MFQRELTVGVPGNLSTNSEAELLRRHKATATTVAGLLIAVVLLSLVAYLGKGFFRRQPNPSVDIALRILILIFGLGAIVLRRTRFSTMRLQDIGALKGRIGLMATLERTTIQLAVLGAAIAASGFIGTLMTGNDLYTYWAGLIAIVVLLYCYPTRTSWQRAVQQFAPANGEAQVAAVDS